MDDIVESLNDVGLKDRSMVWNTDLVEVRRLFSTTHLYICDDLAACVALIARLRSAIALLAGCMLTHGHFGHSGLRLAFCSHALVMLSRVATWPAFFVQVANKVTPAWTSCGWPQPPGRLSTNADDSSRDPSRKC